jgi:hypothetical protein
MKVGIKHFSQHTRPFGNGSHPENLFNSVTWDGDACDPCFANFMKRANVLGSWSVPLVTSCHPALGAASVSNILNREKRADLEASFCSLSELVDVPASHVIESSSTWQHVHLEITFPCHCGHPCSFLKERRLKRESM